MQQGSEVIQLSFCLSAHSVLLTSMPKTVACACASFSLPLPFESRHQPPAVLGARFLLLPLTDLVAVAVVVAAIIVVVAFSAAVHFKQV